MKKKDRNMLGLGVVFGVILGLATRHLALGIAIGIAAAFLFSNIQKMK